MARLVNFSTFFSIIVTAQMSKANSGSDSKMQLPQSPAGDINMALSCVLFGDQACHVECTLTSQLYGYKTYGTCTKNQNCLCHPYSKTPTDLRKEWKKNFNASYVYSQIVKDKESINTAERLLSEPLATAEELKKQLKSVLTPYQYSQLETNDRTWAAVFIKNDEIDEQAVQKHISNQLDTFWKYAYKDRTLLRVNYQDRFKQTLENIRDTGTLYNFAYKIARLRNKTLNGVFEEYLNNHNIKKPDVKIDEEPGAIEVLHYLIINEFIKRNDAEQRGITSSFSAKNSAASTYRRPYS